MIIGLTKLFYGKALWEYSFPSMYLSSLWGLRSSCEFIIYPWPLQLLQCHTFLVQLFWLVKLLKLLIKASNKTLFGKILWLLLSYYFAFPFKKNNKIIIDLTTRPAWFWRPAHQTLTFDFQRRHSNENCSKL